MENRQDNILSYTVTLLSDSFMINSRVSWSQRATFCCAPIMDGQITPDKTGKDVRYLTERHVKAAGEL